MSEMLYWAHYKNWRMLRSTSHHIQANRRYKLHYCTLVKVVVERIKSVESEAKSELQLVIIIDNQIDKSDNIFRFLIGNSRKAINLPHLLHSNNNEKNNTDTRKLACRCIWYGARKIYCDELIVSEKKLASSYGVERCGRHRSLAELKLEELLHLSIRSKL